MKSRFDSRNLISISLISLIALCPQSPANGNEAAAPVDASISEGRDTGQALSGSAYQQSRLLEGGANKQDDADISVRQYKMRSVEVPIGRLNDRLLEGSIFDTGKAQRVPILKLPVQPKAAQFMFPTTTGIGAPSIQLPARTSVSRPDIDSMIESEMRNAALKGRNIELQVPNSSFQADAWQSRTVGKQIDAELSNSTRSPRQVPDIEYPSRDTNQDSRLTRVIDQEESYALQSVNASMIRAEKELEAELVKAKLATQANIAAASSAIEVGLRLLPQTPELVSPASASVSLPEIDNRDLRLAWDDWHRRFVMLLKPALLKSFRESNNPSGINTVLIKVNRKREIIVQLVSGYSPDFDRATIVAYTSLSGSPGLVFPPGSRRQEVSFYLDNKKEIGITAGVKGQSIRGDLERIGQ